MEVAKLNKIPHAAMRLILFLHYFHLLEYFFFLLECFFQPEPLILQHVLF